MQTVILAMTISHAVSYGMAVARSFLLIVCLYWSTRRNGSAALISDRFRLYYCVRFQTSTSVRHSMLGDDAAHRLRARIHRELTRVGATAATLETDSRVQVCIFIVEDI